jgi:hypothetical protein
MIFGATNANKNVYQNRRKSIKWGAPIAISRSFAGVLVSHYSYSHRNPKSTLNLYSHK